MEYKRAVIFDMDGVLVDNNPWHIEAWTTFCKRHGVQMSIEDIMSHFGNTNSDYLAYLFKRKLSPGEIKQMGEEKEEIYRAIYEPNLKPLNGLLSLLDLLEREQFAIALATSAPPVNVEFTLDGLGIRSRFNKVIDETFIRNGKPDPEIYLLASKELNIPVRNCMVFEDSIHGVQAAVYAGMHTVGVLTSQKREKLALAEKLINDFTEVSLDFLENLFTK